MGFYFFVRYENDHLEEKIVEKVCTEIILIFEHLKTFAIKKIQHVQLSHEIIKYRNGNSGSSVIW